VCFGVSGKESEAPGGPARGGRLGEALVAQRLFHVRRHTRGDDGSFEWYVLNSHTRRRASRTFKNSAAAEAPRAQLQATFDRHSRVRDDDRPTVPALPGTWP
jgi:hypothetical protein